MIKQPHDPPLDVPLPKPEPGLPQAKIHIAEPGHVLAGWKRAIAVMQEARSKPRGIRGKNLCSQETNDYYERKWQEDDARLLQQAATERRQEFLREEGFNVPRRPWWRKLWEKLT